MMVARLRRDAAALARQFSKSRAMARPRGGDRRLFVVLYGGGIRRTLTGALTLPNRQPGGRSGDRAAAFGLDSARDREPKGFGAIKPDQPRGGAKNPS